MSVTWTNELELMLVECYHSEPILWDAKHKDHKNKIKVNDAWLRIKEIMNIEVNDLKKKKDSLMSSYRTYKKKVKDSIKSGASTDDIYKPIWFAHEAFDAFLGDCDNCKKTINTEEESVVDNEEVVGAQDVQSPNDQKKLPQTIRRRKSPPELQDAGRVVQDALATLKSTINRKESQSDQDDVYDLYGKMLAKKIRTLPEDDRLLFMYEIDGIYLRHQQNYQHRYNRLIVNSPAQSTSTAYGRPSSSHSTYSEHQSPSPSMLYGRPNTSHSTYSEHTMTSTPSPVAHNLEPAVIHIPDYSRNTGSRVMATSDEVAELPVIHIPDYSRNSGSRVIITSNEVLESPTIHNTNTGTSYGVTEDSQTNSGNIINKAFHFA